MKISATATKCKDFYITKESLKLDWESARSYCKNLRMSLATFNSHEEAVYFNSLNGTGIYNGVNDIAITNTYVQVNGDPLPNIPWQSGEPTHGEANERCLATGETHSKFYLECK